MLEFVKFKSFEVFVKLVDSCVFNKLSSLNAPLALVIAVGVTLTAGNVVLTDEFLTADELLATVEFPFTDVFICVVLDELRNS